jgi:DNA-binding PadR family transcriptional regulator
VRPANDVDGRSPDEWEAIFQFFAMPRRKPGTLVALEAEILAAARALDTPFHGFGLAQVMREQRGSRALTAHGTLYKALGRLEEMGLLTSRWEDADAVVGRPRRRLYELTAEGATAAPRQFSIVTSVPIGVYGHTLAAASSGSSTQPRLCGVPNVARGKACSASPPLK